MDLPFRLPLTATDVSDDSDPYGRKNNGADIILAPTENITHSKLKETDSDDEFSTILKTAVESVAKNLPDNVMIGAVLSPETKFSERHSCGEFEEAVFDYLEKITLIKDCGADLILLKGHSHLWQMRAAVIAAKQANVPIMIVMTVDDEGENEFGINCTAALITLQALGANAFGIECTDGTDDQAELLHNIFPHAEIPLIAMGKFAENSPEQIKTLIYGGAAVFIDTSETPAGWVYDEIRKHESIFDKSSEKDSYAAAVECEVFFLPDNIELSEPIECDYGMSDDLIDMDDENINSICIRLNSSDDAALLAENAAMSRLPVTVHTNDANTLEAALRYFTGRLIVDSRCDIDTKDLHSLTEQYGAILY